VKIRIAILLALVIVGIITIAARADYRIFQDDTEYMPIVLKPKQETIKVENAGRVCFYNFGNPIMLVEMACLSDTCTKGKKSATLVATNSIITITSSLVAQEYPYDPEGNAIPCSADCMGGAIIVDVPSLQQQHGSFSLVWGINSVGVLTLPLTTKSQCFTSP
jgi:hypothetical protein